MRFILLALLACFLFSSCKQKQPVQDTAPANLSSVLKNYWEEYLKLEPLTATYIGDNRFNDQLPNYLTQEYRDQMKQFYTAYKDSLKRFDRNALSAEDKLSYDVLSWTCDIELEGMEFKDYLMPVKQFWSFHLDMGQLAAGRSVQPFVTAQDYDNWEKRVDVFVAWCDTAIVLMKKGIAEKIVLPKKLAVKTIPQLRALAQSPVEKNIFYTPINNFTDKVSEEDRKRLRTSYAAMINDRLAPAITRLADFMEKEYLPACRTTSGIGDLPGGDKLYQYRIKHFTTLNKTADEIFELGNREVERIAAEMEKIKQEVSFKGTLQEFFNHVRTKKELMPFKSPGEVIANFNRIHQTMEPYLKDLFDHTPKAKFEVRRTEAFREKSASAEYSPSSLDGSRPGIFYVPIPDVRKYNVLADESLFLHEAIPGHHYQSSLQQENTALPEFRKVTWYSAYGEGWGLYSESLGSELGLYTDPYQRLGMLSQEMHRAIRLVVDVGLHAKGWTREQAIAFSLKNEADSEEGIVAEIERYMAIPGQALSYKIGQLKIRELRSRAEEALGVAFDIRAFHNQILDSGSLPLKTLEQKIDDWIATQKKEGAKAS